MGKVVSEGGKMMAITRRQREVLDFIEAFTKQNRYSPSFQEVADGLDLKSLATVHKHISNLRRKGYLTQSQDTHQRSRALEVSKPMSVGTRFKVEGERLWDFLENCYWVRENNAR